jgi:hypothetical protein
LHIEENKIELFIIDPEGFNNKEKNEILLHLDSCSYCKEIYNTYNNFYCDIEVETKKKPNVNEEDVAQRIMSRIQKSDDSKLLSENSEAVQIHNGKTEIVIRHKLFSLQNIYYFIKNYPIQSFGFAVITALAIAFIVGQVKIPMKNNNPFSVKINNNILEIYNNLGDILWTKPAMGIHVREIDALVTWPYEDQKCIGLLDIDSNGKNEVLIAGNENETGFFSHDSLYCFNYDGSLRWVISGGIGEGTNVPKWKVMKSWIRDFFTIKVGKVNKLFMISNDRMYGGAVLSELNPKNGEILSSIFHAGWFSAQIHLDLNGDGKEEIILGGTSSDYDRPFLLVLNYGTAAGVIPRNVTHFEDNKIKTNPLYYMLFPISELGKRESKSTNNDVIALLKAKNDEILVSICDVKLGENKYVSLVYTLDIDMKIQSIMADNGYEKLYADQLKTGIIRQHLDAAFFKALTDSIKYWDGDRFVNYSVKNKYWKK